MHGFRAHTQVCPSFLQPTVKTNAMACMRLAQWVQWRKLTEVNRTRQSSIVTMLYTYPLLLFTKPRIVPTLVVMQAGFIYAQGQRHGIKIYSKLMDRVRSPARLTSVTINMKCSCVHCCKYVLSYYNLCLYSPTPSRISEHGLQVCSHGNLQESAGWLLRKVSVCILPLSMRYIWCMYFKHFSSSFSFGAV